MLGSNKKNQVGANDSTNLQGESIIINNGISYSDAKAIALDVFKSNFLELSNKATITAKKRAEEIVDDFLINLQKISPNSLSSLENPGFQYSLYNVQKEYAKTGEKELSHILVDILVERAQNNHRSLMQIVLDESISIVSKLTIEQMNVLSLIFLLRYFEKDDVLTHKKLKDFIKHYLTPFISTFQRQESLLFHLEFSGCIVYQQVENIQHLFRANYTKLFTKGFSYSDFRKSLGEDKFEYYKSEKIIVNSSLNDSKYNFHARNENHLRDILVSLHCERDFAKSKTLFLRGSINDKELIQILESFDKGKMSELILFWNTSSMKKMTLTSVGLAVAKANIRRKRGCKLNSV
ncbi:LPO_1073/Vpar_1526 family protein [Pseudozobellia sp. WGM2]|uniref:LPO_1073/Vpar_1526 family protein n=1 Tax=Pseudozobellia sp. WGM2 TaxID=2787625 RepID=UPI001AE06705|nr:LPO_1073/Vpar_1526 family protein [Pseudozobellia sp. WGM2]